MHAVLHSDVFKSTIYTYRTYDLFIVRFFIFIVSYLFIDYVFIQWITHFSDQGGYGMDRYKDG